MLTAVYLV